MAIDYESLALELLSFDTAENEAQRQSTTSTEDGTLENFLSNRQSIVIDKDSDSFAHRTRHCWIKSPGPDIIQWDVNLPIDGLEYALEAIEKLLDKAGLKKNDDRKENSYHYKNVVRLEDAIEYGLSGVPHQFFFHSSDLEKIQSAVDTLNAEKPSPSGQNVDGDGKALEPEGHQHG